MKPGTTVTAIHEGQARYGMVLKRSDDTVLVAFAETETQPHGFWTYDLNGHLVNYSEGPKLEEWI